MTFDADFVGRLLLGNLAYGLLVISMMMTGMLWLRLFAIASGIVSLFYSIYYLHDPVFAFWDAVFTLVNVVQIALNAYGNFWARFSSEEQMFYDRVVPALEPNQARRLFRVGTWLDAEAGTKLVSQGEPVSYLLFLQSGTARVLVDDTLVSTCAAGSLVGEIEMASGAPAAATVIAQEPLRYLAFEGNTLRKLILADADIAKAITHGNLRNLEVKLGKMNQSVVERA